MSAAFQRDFVAALRHDAARDGAPPAAVAALLAQPGFAVYRNTVARGCVEALSANHPVVHQVVGDDWFDAAAAIHARAAPPRDGRLALYGDGFADFLDGFAPAAELPYLADVARWDRRWTEAHAAVDAPVLGAASIAALDPASLAAARLVPHPSARWAWTDAHPAFTVWQRHRDGAALDTGIDWTRGDGGLVVRPIDAVVWCALDAGSVAFLDDCAAGACFGDAAERLGDRIAVAFPALLAVGAFTALGAFSR